MLRKSCIHTKELTVLLSVRIVSYRLFNDDAENELKRLGGSKVKNAMVVKFSIDSRP